MTVAKKGMKRPDWTHTHSSNQLDPVPELQGTAKQSKEKAKPIISGTKGPSQKVYHMERPIPTNVYPAIDTDLARDNLENDLTAADCEDL